jgi:hypothetical protein
MALKGGEESLQKMGDILSDITMEKAIKDKTQEATDDLENEVAKEQGNLNLKSGGGLLNLCFSLEDEVIEKKRDLDSDDEEMDEEEAKIMRDIREKRMEEMKSEHHEARENLIKGHGKYTEITESEFLDYVTQSKNVACHFYHRDFERCKIIDMHLKIIAQLHPECRFITLNVEKAPFFITKLQIKVLPTIVMFINGVAVDRTIGFDEIGGRDDFPTLNLIRRMVKSKLLIPKNKKEKGQIDIAFSKKEDDSSDDES